MNYTITENNLHIEDSYKVGKNDFVAELTAIKYAKIGGVHPNMASNVWKRAALSLEAEWAVHNALYALGLFRSRTKDVDLNYPNKLEWLYKIVGVLVWPFIG